MRLTDVQERTLDRWLSAVETGTPDGDYSKVTILSDNPKGKPQITYGKHQTTEVGGNLKKLIRQYLGRRDAEISDVRRNRLQGFIKAPQYSMADNNQLRSVLRISGDDPVMQDVQNEFFLEEYLKPSRRWADDHGFKEALSMLVIYDSFIQSGGIPSWIRRRFREAPPFGGGNEEKWTSAYVDARHSWLKYWGNGKTEKSKLIRNSRYRTHALNIETDRGNWDLSMRPMEVNGILVVSEKIPTKQPNTCRTCGGPI